MTRAAIDVGSNSVLLTVETSREGVWSMVDETSEVTGLGTDVKVTGRLRPDAIERTLSAVERAWKRAKEIGVDDIRAGGTMAVRIAENAPDFIDSASKQGTPISIITGESEAKLGFLSVANDSMFAHNNRISIIDPGGHSTELVTAWRTDSDQWSVEFQQSFPIGTLAMLSTVFQEERPNALAQISACQQIDDAIAERYELTESGPAITLGATGTNLVSIREKLATWQPDRVHGAFLDYEEISKAVSWLSEMTIEERSKIVGMEPGRAGTLHAGALILERFLNAIRAPGCFVSVRGWRHAWLELGYPDSV